MVEFNPFPAHTRVVIKVLWIRTSLNRQAISAVIGGGGGDGAVQHVLPASQNAPLKTCTLTRNLKLFVRQFITSDDS